MINSEGRLCTCCEIFKSSDEFYLNKYGKLRSNCKACAHNKAKDLYKKQIKARDTSIVASRMATRAFQRCSRTNDHNPYYQRYNISMEFDNHAELKDYIHVNFSEDIKELLDAGKTPSLDRINANCNYEKGNLRVIDFTLNTELGRNTFAARNSKPLMCTTPTGENVAFKNVITASIKTGISRKLIRKCFNEQTATRSGYRFQLIEEGEE